VRQAHSRASSSILPITLQRQQHVALLEEGHIGPIEQGFIGNRLHRQGTDLSEFIHARYLSLVKFLQDGSRNDDFVLSVGSKGTCFIDHAPKLVLPKPFG
jgi:hypothetical protein